MKLARRGRAHSVWWLFWMLSVTYSCDCLQWVHHVSKNVCSAVLIWGPGLASVGVACMSSWQCDSLKVAHFKEVVSAECFLKCTIVADSPSPSLFAAVCRVNIYLSFLQVSKNSLQLFHLSNPSHVSKIWSESLGEKELRASLFWVLCKMWAKMWKQFKSKISIRVLICVSLLRILMCISICTIEIESLFKSKCWWEENIFQII